jgi:hypothetical protein
MVGEATAAEQWLADAKKKLAEATEEQEATIPATSASLSVLTLRPLSNDSPLAVEKPSESTAEM